MRRTLALLLLFAAPALAAASAGSAPLPFPLIERFESFGVGDGLPAWKVHCVLVDGPRVWAGTTKGLVLREGGKFHVIGPEQGMTHSVVSSLAIDPATGDLWAGTFRGLNRISAGKVIETFTQTSSGLPNDVVYSVAVGFGSLWAATAAGVGRYELKNRTWHLYDSTNTIMHEPWTYAIAPTPDRIFMGVWAGGIIEHDPAKGTFKEYRDPDGEMEIDLLPDDGPVHEVTSWAAWDDGLLWQASYFGMARYDGTRWRSWLTEKTPLVSNFINFIAAKGKVAWVCTDKGLVATDGDSWATYQKGKLEIVRPGGAKETRGMGSALPNDFVLGASLGDGEIWLATSHGLSRGVFAGAARGGVTHPAAATTARSTK